MTSNHEIGGAVATFLEIGLATVLASAALAKLVAGPRWPAALSAYRIGWLARPAVVWTVPVLESAVAVTLVLSAEPYAAVAASGLFGAFAAVLMVARARGAEGSCECFGSILKTQIGPASIGRALLLAGIAAAVLVLPKPVPNPAMTGAIVLAVAAGAQLVDALRALLVQD